MGISRTRLIYNLSIIVISAILAIIFYPSAISGFLIVVATIGAFMTLDRVAPISKKNALFIGIPIAILFFIFIFTTMLTSS